MAASSEMMMAASTGIAAMSSGAGAFARSQGLQGMASYQRSVAAANSGLADIQAEDAQNRGEITAQRAGLESRQRIGDQRAKLAAQGVDVNSGSAAQVQEDTAAIGALDELTIRNNAWREAWGYKQQALNATAQGEFASMASENEANNTLLAGGMSVLSGGLRAWGEYNRPTGVRG